MTKKITYYKIISRKHSLLFIVIEDFIKKLRRKNNYTQEQIASVLGISRQSYALLENKKSEITLNQIEKLADFYNITKENFINQKENSIIINIINDSKKEDCDIRINIPQKNIDKFKNILLYILSNIGAKPNVGQTVLYKILYFIDFDFYEKYEKQLMGITYIKNHHGPTPVEFKKVIEDMKKNKELEEIKRKYFDHEQTKYLPLKDYDLTNLSAIEKQHIDEELNRLSNKNATELSDLSHKDVPWIITDYQKPIDYESVFYRTSETSVRKYDNL